MCYPKPGPRCASALKARKSTLREKLQEAQAAGREDQAEQIAASMKKLNNEFALTTEGLKTLRKKVKSGDIDESLYAAAKAERKRRIHLAKNGLQDIPKGYGTMRALESTLTYEGTEPKWLSKDGVGPFGSKPEILDVIDTRAGKMAVTWEDESLAENDIHVQTERGFHIHRLALRDIKTGKIHGYLKIQRVDAESMKRSYGDDEWSAMRFYSDRGNTFMIRYDENGNKTDLSTLLQDPNTRLEAKKEIWLGAHRATQSPSKSVAKSYYQLSKEDAPSEQEMDKDLASLQEEYMVEEWNNYQNNHGTPSIDYSRLEDSLRGQGLGPAMYVYGARKLAEKGKYLRSSSIQSDDAGELWDRMSKDSRLPISTRSHQWAHEDKPIDVMALDFTEQPKK